MAKNFLAIRHTEDFLELSFEELRDLITRDEIFVPTEEPIFEAVLSWVRKDEKNRKEHMPELLSQVRLPLLKPAFITDRVASEGKNISF